MLEGDRVGVYDPPVTTEAAEVTALHIIERALLDLAGFREDALAATLALERSREALEELMGKRGSISVAEAATALGLPASRIRRRVGTERSLYGVKRGREWRLPLFQFSAPSKSRKLRDLVRNIETVLPVLPADVHPLAVRSFFLTENPDLVVGDDEAAVSPIAWLNAGNSPADVIALAKEL